MVPPCGKESPGCANIVATPVVVSIVNRGDPSIKAVAYNTSCSSNIMPMISASESFVVVSTPVMLATCCEEPVLVSMTYKSLAVGP